MGIDAEIAFRLRGELGDVHVMGNSIHPKSTWHPADATHQVYTTSRYYGEGYERGHWPSISGILLVLMADDNVERVWYGGDNADELPIMTPERIVQITQHWLANGGTPYRDYKDTIAAKNEAKP